jgi:hypothetical protein
MAFNLQGGYGAAAGADMLQDILKQKAMEYQAQQRLKIAEQEMQQRAAAEANDRAFRDRSQTQTEKYQQGQLERQSAADKATAEDRAEQRHLGRLVIMPKGTRVSGKDAEEFTKYGTSGLLKPGMASPARPTPDFVGPMEPQPTGDYEFTGTQAAADKEAAAKAAADEREAQRKFLAGEHELTRNATAALAANKPQPLMLVTTVNDQGETVKSFQPKVAGKEFVQPKGATTANRVDSAKVVNATGTDIVKKLSDPAFAATVGPALGRFNTLRDLIGNPPPEMSELAGQIESYALANMGVHGMRSVQGAQHIKDLLDRRHTPESLAATIKGLNDFSTRFVEANTPRNSGGGSTGGGGGKTIRARDPQGNLHEAAAGTPLPAGWKIEGS